MVTKQQLRNNYKQLRLQISSKEKLRLDDLLLLQLQKLNLSSVETLLTYWGIAANNEPNTHLFTSYARHFVPELQIAYPKSDFGSNTMQAVLINENTVYSTNHYGITEPKEGSIVNPQTIDLIFVPLLICDMQGFRVGYGKGFYDKFIASCNPNVVTIGFNYFEPVDIISNIEEHDIPLCYCITPTKIYEF